MTTAEQAELDAAAEAIASDCADEFGERLEQVATDDTVRDLDLLRRAVGDDQLTYLGFSYGTSIGLRYAERFPEQGPGDRARRRRRPHPGPRGAAHRSGDRLRDLDRRLRSRRARPSASCPLTDPAATYDRVQEALEAEPLEVSGADPVGPTSLAFAAMSSAYDGSRASSFLEALAAADEGDGSLLARLADLYFSSTSYTEYAAVVCTDNPHPEGAEEHREMADRMAEVAPRFGAAVANEMAPCAFWAGARHGVAGARDRRGSGTDPRGRQHRRLGDPLRCGASGWPRTSTTRCS